MKKLACAVKILCFIVFCFLSAPPPSSAIMKGLSTEELTNTSDMVISGEVEKTEAQWSNDGTIIVTTADIIIDTVVRGASHQKRIRVEYEGGEVGEIGLKVSDQPSFTGGEKVILFLKSGKSKKDGDVYNVVGKGQGKYVVGEDGIARKSGFSVAYGEDNIDNDIPAKDLIEKIKGIAK